VGARPEGLAARPPPQQQAVRRLLEGGVALPLAYYSVAADQEFWNEHWGGHTTRELLDVARTSPLTELITSALQRDGTVLEAGCGLGQYVVLLRERGWRAAGADASLDALRTCRQFTPVPLAAMRLEALAVRDGALAAYVSLGVVEHVEAGPDAILAEAARALRPGGVAIVSVPYLNGVRRLARPWLVRRNHALARRGAAFYQYAFTRAELVAALADHGLVTLAAHPYDPARLLRRFWRRAAGSRPVGGGDSAPRRETLGGVVRRALYTEAGLRLLGHMLLAVACKR
jgi:SAM-dependent methyltransferase